MLLFKTSHRSSVPCRIIGFALTAALPAFPLERLSAQAAADSTTTERPTALGAIVISATRTEQALRSLPLHVTVIGTPAIATSAAQTMQDLLRRIPGFTTRDFQAGLVSGPSQSIVSFRGLGGSSAGRALVLLDGIPAGDPFSGWLDWGRIPLPMLESAEVVRGGGSVIWGSRSLGGVVNLRTITPDQDEARLMLEGGSMSTVRAAGSGSLRRGNVAATLGTDIWQTDGFVVLRADQAGPADEPESVGNRTFSGKVTWDASQSLQAWLAGGAYTGGEIPLGSAEKQTFDEGRGGVRWLNGRGVVTISAFINRRTALTEGWTFNSDRTSTSPQRTTFSPAHSTGGSLQWTLMAFDRHELTAGADFTSAGGSTVERYSFVDDSPTAERTARGNQWLGGIFLQDAADLGGGIRMVASLRGDRVSNSDGRRIVRDLTAGSVVSDSALTELATNRMTWSLGLRWQQADWLGWRGSVYEAFRTPSMYEMYYARFSSRGTVTEANAALEAERLRGGEVGVDLTLSSRLIARVTAFTNRVRSPIMDVTIGTAGDQAEVIAPCGLMPARQTCSQRQNVPALRSRGIESEVEWQANATWDVSAGYAFSPSRVIAPGHPADGMRAIRSARHMITSSLTYASPRWATVGLDARYVGSRFDDDRNTVKLDGFYLVGLRVNRPLGRGITAYVKAENLLDEEFEIARTRSGQADMGAPRWVTVGMTARW